MIKSLCAVALAALATAASPVCAQDIVLRYGDLDVAQPAGARTLDARITAQARTWCDAQDPVTGSLLRDAGCPARVAATLHASLPAATQRAYAAARAVDAPILAARR